MLGTHIDITERKQAGERLFELAERLRLANKATNDVIWDWDILQDTQQWNDAGTAVFGWTEIVEHPVSATWWVDRVHPDDQKRVHDSFFAAVNNPEITAWHDEYRFRKADGAYADVMDRGYVLRNEHGRAIRMIGAMQNITERKRAQEKLRESSERFQAIASNTPDHIILHDKELRYTLVVNPQLGLTEQEMLGKTDYDLLTRDEADRLTSIKKQVLATGAAVQYQTSLRSKKGAAEFFEGTFMPRFDAHGHTEGLLGYFRNITERKLAEDRIRAALQEKEVLMREILHRTKNNMEVIRNLLALQSQATGDRVLAKAFGDMQTRIRSMALVHETLYKSEDMSTIDMKDYLQSLANTLLAGFLSPSKPIALAFDADSVIVSVDSAVPCGLAINELLTNALKHAFPGNRPGSIALSLHKHASGEIHITVEDDGIGLPDRALNQATTLGLTLVRSLIEQQLEGSLEFKTDSGTQVHFSFTDHVAKRI